MARWKNVDWIFNGDEGATNVSIERIRAALLMDIRDELQTLNRLLSCRNFLDIPGQLRTIAKNTEKKKRLRIVKFKKAS